jgi:outer membrane protein TolC
LSSGGLVQAEQENKLTLTDLLQAALAHDGRVLAAHAQLDHYRAKYDEAKWLWFPAAKLRVLFGYPVGERRLHEDCAGDPTCTKLETNWRGIFSDDWGKTSFAVGGKIEATLPLYTFGKLSQAKRAARAGVSGSETNIDKARQEVALEVRRAYYGWLLSISALDILEDGAGKLKEAEKKLIKMLDELNEEVTDRDLFKLRYHTAKVKSMIIEAKKGHQLTLAALSFLTGIEGLGKDQHLAEIDLGVSNLEFQSREQYFDHAKRLRPELKMLKNAIDASQAAVEIQKAYFYPDFFLSGYVDGSYSPVHDHITNPLLNSTLTYWGSGLALGFQITLDFPQKMARLEQARANLKKIEIQANQAQEAVLLEIDKRLEDLNSAKLNKKTLRKGHRAAKAWMRANWMSYGVGLSNTKDLLDSLAAYALSKMELDKANHDLMVAVDQMKASVGENLFQNP